MWKHKEYCHSTCSQPCAGGKCQSYSVATSAVLWPMVSPDSNPPNLLLKPCYTSIISLSQRILYRGWWSNACANHIAPPNCYWSWEINPVESGSLPATSNAKKFWMVAFGVEFQRFSTRGINQIIERYVRHIAKKAKCCFELKGTTKLNHFFDCTCFSICRLSVDVCCGCLLCAKVTCRKYKPVYAMVNICLEMPKSTKRSEMFSLSGNESIFHQTGKGRSSTQKF